MTDFRREFREFFGSTSLAPSQMNRLLIQLAALVGGGFLKRSELSPSSLHAVLAELIVAVEERFPFVAEHKGFAKFLAFADALSPLALSAIVKTLYAAADEEVLVPSVFAVAGFSGERDPLYYLSDEVASLMLEFAQIEPTDRIHFSYVSSFCALRLASNRINHFVFQDPITTFEAVMLAVMIGASLECHRSAPTSPPETSESKPFDASIVVLPVGTPYTIVEDAMVKRVEFKLSTRELESLVFNRMLRTTRKRSVALIPLRVLFAPGKAERSLRQRLVEDHRLDTVVKLPSGVISTAAPDSALIVLRGSEDRSTDGPLVVDASGDEFHFAPYGRDAEFLLREQMQNITRLKEIVNGRLETEISKCLRTEEMRATGFNLMPERYNSMKDRIASRSFLARRGWTSLSSIATLSRPVAIPYFDGRSLEADLRPVKEASIADIGPSGLLQTPAKFILLDRRGFEKNRKVMLRPKDILLVVKGNVGKVAFVPEDLAEEWLPNQSFVVIRVHEGEARISSEFLFRYLASPLSQKSLAMFTGGNSTKVLLAADLRHFEIPIPDDELHEKVLTAHSGIVEHFLRASELESVARSIEKDMWEVPELAVFKL